MNRYFSLASADVVVPNLEAWGLLWDFECLKELIETLPGNTSLQNQCLVAANEIINVFGKGDRDDIRHARKIAERIFGEGWEGKREKVYHDGVKIPTIWGIGYCHIDTAW